MKDIKQVLLRRMKILDNLATHYNCEYSRTRKPKYKRRANECSNDFFTIHAIWLEAYNVQPDLDRVEV